MFNNAPTITARDIPEIETDKSPYTNDNDAPPNPRTSIVAAYILGIVEVHLIVN